MVDTEEDTEDCPRPLVLLPLPWLPPDEEEDDDDVVVADLLLFPFKLAEVIVAGELAVVAELA